MTTSSAAIPAWRNPVVILLCGCLIALIGFGLRSSLGVFTDPVSAGRGWSREVFALAIALQNLLWGLGQPLAGAVADRFGTARVLVAGGLLYALGIALMALAPTPGALYLSGGVLVGLGLSGAAFPVVIAAFGRLLPPERRSWAFGMGTAAGSLGQFVFAPLGQAFIAAYGWETALLLLAGTVALIPLLAPPLAGRGAAQAAAGETTLGFRDALQRASGHGSYWLLLAGFFVCGFHVAFITTHLPPYLTDLGVSPALAAWSIGLIGLFNIVGSYSSGVLGARYPKRHLLSGLYAARAVAIALFLLLPPSPAVTLAFAAAMGLLWLSTVPLTSGLVAVMFGTRYLGTLFGLVFLSHQVGAFLGVWLGGALYARFGSYDPVWWIAVALSVLAAALHWPIREARAPAFAVTEAT